MHLEDLYIERTTAEYTFVYTVCPSEKAFLLNKETKPKRLVIANINQKQISGSTLRFRLLSKISCTLIHWINTDANKNRAKTNRETNKTGNKKQKAVLSFISISAELNFTFGTWINCLIISSKTLFKAQISKYRSYYMCTT